MTESREKLKEFLTRTPFFGGVADEALERLVAMTTERGYVPGELVFREGESGRSMFVILDGQVVMSQRGGSGAEVRLFRLGLGDFFGETTLIEMQPRPYTARVEAPTTLLELTGRDLYRLYQEDVRSYVLVLQNINRELCRRLREADGRITEIADDLGDERTQIHLPSSVAPRDRHRT